MAKVLCKPHFEKHYLVMGCCETGMSKSAKICPKCISMIGHKPIMDTLLKFGIGADSSTFRLPRFATPYYQMGFFKTGFAENLGLYPCVCPSS